MKRAKLFLIGALVAIPLLGFAITTHAQTFRSGDNVTVAANKTVNGTLFASGRNIDIAGTVAGDVFCAGQTVTVTGTVQGDVICAGQNVRVTGTVEGDVRVAAQNTTIGGTVSNNLTVATQAFNSESGSRVERDAAIAGKDVAINGEIGRDLAVTSGNVTIDGLVGRDVQANVRTLTLGENAKIDGNVDYTSTKKLERDSSAVVAGKITQKEPAKEQQDEGGQFAAFFALFCFLAMLLSALVLVLLMPQVFQSASTVALANLGKTFLIGFGASLIVPVLILMLLFTIFGIPLALLLLLVWLAILFLSGPFAAYLTGRMLLRENATNAIWIMLLGAIVLLVLYFVPVLGILVALAALWFGIGMILQQVRVTRPKYQLAGLGTDEVVTTTKTQTRAKPSKK